MEEFHLPSHLIENIAEMNDFTFKHKHNTLLAFNSKMLKVLSHHFHVIGQSEAPLMGFSRVCELTPKNSISDAFIYRSGVYSVHRPQSNSLFSKWTDSSSISMFNLDEIADEYVIN